MPARRSRPRASPRSAAPARPPPARTRPRPRTGRTAAGARDLRCDLRRGLRSDLRRPAAHRRRRCRRRPGTAARRRRCSGGRPPGGLARPLAGAPGAARPPGRRRVSPVARRQRLDAELVRRGLARSREHAGELVAAGRVTVGGAVASKPATQVEASAAVVVKDDADDAGWASRGAHKLLGALEATGVAVEGRRCLDAGASTGGFTDVLLRAGAASVVAVDVGYGQLLWRLRNDDRVEVHDRTNVRELTAEQVAPAPSLVVADLSFISLRLVLPALVRSAAPDADLLLMVKPQFEVGRERLGSGGVVRDPQLRASAVRDVVAAAGELGLRLHACAASPLPGPSGNVEYFVHLRGGEPLPPEEVEQLVATAVAEGPGGTP
nr:TlyA family RNA methyltransferase [Quadrisphaera sp. RL12-1S]